MKLNSDALKQIMIIRPIIEQIARIAKGTEETVKDEILYERTLAWQRAVARKSADYYAGIARDFGSIRALIMAARKRQEAMTKQFPERDADDVATAALIASILARRIADRSREFVLNAMAFIARNSLRATSEHLGFGATLEVIWSDPRVAFASRFPVSAANAASRFDATTQTYVARVSNIITNAASSDVSTTEAVKETRGLIRRLTKRTVKEQVRTATNQIGNDIRAETFERNNVQEKRWLTVAGTPAANVSPVDPVCLRNAAAGWIPIDQPYPSGKLHPLEHPNCRCWEEGRLTSGELPEELVA